MIQYLATNIYISCLKTPCSPFAVDYELNVYIWGTRDGKLLKTVKGYSGGRVVYISLDINKYKGYKGGI